MERVELEFQQPLIEINEPIEDVYFLYDAVSSTTQEITDGSVVEAGLMGVERMVGIQLWLRVPTTPSRTFVQVPGRSHRMTAQNFTREVIEKPNSQLNTLLARYVHGFLLMTSVAAACNHLHTADEPLCRWLKLVHNRVRRDTFPMRHEFLAQMLGVHRPSVSIAANMLQKAGLITYSRGRISVLDQKRLKEGTCECYDLMETQYQRISQKFQPLSPSINETNPKNDAAFPHFFPARKYDNALNQHYLETRRTIERVYQSCKQSELLYREQLAMIAKQREELKLIK